MRGGGVFGRVLATVVPTAADHRPALRVALGLAVPGVALLIAGHPDLLIYAVFGAITGMYGRDETRRRRFTHQAHGAAMLLTGVGVGVVLSGVHAASWVLVLTVVVCAAAGSVATDYLALKPEGPFFGLFALGAVATVPAGRVAPWMAVSICGATALFCIVLGFADTRGSRARGRSHQPIRVPPHRSEVLIHAARYALAVSAAGAGGLLLGVDHANWAMTAAAGPLAAADTSGRVRRGIHRLLGTLAGLVVAALLLIPQPDEYVLAVCMMALMFPTELYMARHHALAMGFFTPLIMVMTDLADPAEPLALLADRGIDTLIGVGAAITVAMLIRSPPARGASLTS
jgi:hypothetical protein